MRATYGMLPIKARFLGKCGCGRVFAERDGWPAGTPCRFGAGDLIVRFRGAWCNLICIDRIKQDEFKASARFVLEDVITLRSGEVRRVPKAWTNDEAEAAKWRRLAEELSEIDPALVERVIDRQAAA